MSQSNSRTVRLFRNGRNQAVRIPVEFELPGDEAVLRREGGRLILEPMRKKGLAALLASWDERGVDFPVVDDPAAKPETIF